MVSADFFKKAAICGAAVSVIGAAFFHHRIQGEQRSGNLVNTTWLWAVTEKRLARTVSCQVEKCGQTTKFPLIN